MGLGHIMTLANSIIGVSVLAMPFCFKQCGIILSILVLFLSSFMTRLACHFLLKAAVLARRRNYEFLAFHAFGPKGKLMVELCVIGFLFGTCIAFFVVMGDLGPAIVSEVLGISKSPSVRSSVLLGLALLVVLPLGLLRNVDSLSSLCTATILFYFFLVLKIMSEATTHLLAGDWIQYVHLWRPAGILQCIPIFAMALSCQTQVFEIYETLPDPSLPKMNEVVRAAVNICTGVYVCMGFFGYVAVCRPSSLMDGMVIAPAPALSGNILMSFPSSFVMQTIKLFFVASIACSFPLVIFPCRASLHSLLFRRAPHHESGISGASSSSMAPSTANLLPPGSSGGQAMERIPERRFRLLTISLVAGSLAVAFALPDIELVLGLVGSSIGTITCLLLPALCFLKVAPSHPYHHSHWGGGKGVTAERLLAQVMIVVGTTILVLSTYANLHAVDQAHTDESVTPQSLYEGGILVPKIPAGLSPGHSNVGDDESPMALPKVIHEVDTPKKDVSGGDEKNAAISIKKDVEIKEEPLISSGSKQVKPEKRQEPPIPEAPDNKIKKKQQQQPDGDSKDKKKRDGEEQPKQSVEWQAKAGEGKRVEVGKEMDSVHGDAIKKEEEEVGIEEGTAKREEEERKKREEAEAARKREEKELLQKLADDRKKQQELINVQMEILKKLEALEGKKSEKEEFVAVDTRTDTREVSKNSLPKETVQKTKSQPDSGIKDGASVTEGRGSNKSSVLQSKVMKEQPMKDKSQNEVLGKKQPLLDATVSEIAAPVKHVTPNVQEQLVIEKKKALNSSVSGISQMKAAVPMPLLLVGGGGDDKKERVKREVEDITTVNEVDGNVSSQGEAKENSQVTLEEENFTVEGSKDLQKSLESVEVKPNAENKASSLDVTNPPKVMKESKSVTSKDESVPHSTLLCTLGMKKNQNYLSPTIQTPSRLSNPIGRRSPHSKVDPAVNLDAVVMESMPLKRDLKFIKEAPQQSRKEDEV